MMFLRKLEKSSNQGESELNQIGLNYNLNHDLNFRNQIILLKSIYFFQFKSLFKSIF